MEHNLQLFEHEEFGSVRVVMIDGEPWFVAADVCRVLGLTNPTVAIESLDEDEKRKIPESRVVVDPKFNLGSDFREVNIINESGLYALIFSSRKPEAKKFRKWVTHEVLPSIRKTGTYSVVSVDPLAIEREKLALEREKFNVENSEETKLFKRAQLLRDIASSSRDDVLRDKLIREATKILMGDDFFKKIPDEACRDFGCGFFCCRHCRQKSPCIRQGRGIDACRS